MGTKVWSKPTIEELDVRETLSGGDPSTVERNGFFSSGWHNATYDAVSFEKCEGHGSVIPKKSSMES